MFVTINYINMQYITVQITFFFTLTILFCSAYAETDDEDVRNGATPYILPSENKKRPLVSSLSSSSRRLSISDFFGKPSSQYPTPSYESSNDIRRRCPLCDSSVYSYCSEKLLHDACCCNNPYDSPLPYQCRFADCSFLHANSCKEHRLITACCCTNLYYKQNQPYY